MSERILEKIKSQIEHRVYPGASLALYHQGQWQEYYVGSQDGLEPVTAGLTYDLASVSKVVGVGTLVIFRVNSGALELDRSLTSYYPAFQDERVTIRQLLTHTSGIDPYIPNRDSLNAQELKEAINRLKVTDNKRFHYTDVNFLLLGFLLEEMTGRRLDELIDEEVLEPFGMGETFFGPVSQAVPTVRGQKPGLVHDPKARVLGRHAGSAGLFSTVKDLESGHWPGIKRGIGCPTQAIPVPLSCTIASINRRSSSCPIEPLRRMNGPSGRRIATS